jgi:hypothetical protein
VDDSGRTLDIPLCVLFSEWDYTEFNQSPPELLLFFPLSFHHLIPPQSVFFPESRNKNSSSPFPGQCFPLPSCYFCFSTEKKTKKIFDKEQFCSLLYGWGSF